MKNILITGGRAPVALELARLFHTAGFSVFIADSVKFPLCKASNSVNKTFYITPPKSNLNRFINDLIEVITNNQIDLLIPTCEEVFFIASAKPKLAQHCQVFCDDFEKLHQLHNKWIFTTLAADCGVAVPETVLLQTDNDLAHYRHAAAHSVLKPVYSRFAAETLRCPNTKQLSKISPSQSKPWVIQQFIEGQEYCSYSIAIAGQLTAHACYHPLYRVGQGSGMYFQPINHRKIQTFVAHFVKRYQYTGQIGFDFLEAPHGDIFVLECNPRATSGVHLFSVEDKLTQAFIKTEENVIMPKQAQAKMVAAGMLIFGFPYGINCGCFRQFAQSYRAAFDVIFSKNDPAPSFYQFISLLEALFESVRQRTSLWKAATADIEWNGEKLK